MNTCSDACNCNVHLLFSLFHFLWALFLSVCFYMWWAFATGPETANGVVYACDYLDCFRPVPSLCVYVTVWKKSQWFCCLASVVQISPHKKICTHYNHWKQLVTDFSVVGYDFFFFFFFGWLVLFFDGVCVCAKSESKFNLLDRNF